MSVYGTYVGTLSTRVQSVNESTDVRLVPRAFPPLCFGPRTAPMLWGPVFLSLVSGSVLREAYRPSNEHEDGRPVALKTALGRHYAPPTTI